MPAGERLPPVDLETGRYEADDLSCVLTGQVRLDALTLVDTFGTLFLANGAVRAGPSAATAGACTATWRLAVGETADGDGALVGRLMDGISGCPAIAGSPACADYWRADIVEIGAP